MKVTSRRGRHECPETSIYGAICTAAATLRRRGIHEFHGYELAKQLADASDRTLLTAYGTLYRALARFETMGLLQSRREDPTVTAQENRPGRRLYTLAALAESVVGESSKDVRPICAPMLIGSGYKGDVVLEAKIDLMGKLAEVRVIKSKRMLTPAAIDAVHQWEFDPATVDAGDSVITVTAKLTPG